MRDRSILGVYHALPDKEREQEPELCPPSMDAPRSSSGRDCVRPHMRLWVAHATRRPYRLWILFMFTCSCIDLDGYVFALLYSCA